MSKPDAPGSKLGSAVGAKDGSDRAACPRITREIPPAELEAESPTWTTGTRPSTGVSQTARLGLGTGLVPARDPGRVCALQVIPAQLVDRAGEDEATAVQRPGRLELVVIHVLVMRSFPRDDDR